MDQVGLFRPGSSKYCHHSVCFLAMQKQVLTKGLAFGISLHLFLFVLALPFSLYSLLSDAVLWNFRMTLLFISSGFAYIYLSPEYDMIEIIAHIFFNTSFRVYATFELFQFNKVTTQNIFLLVFPYLICLVSWLLCPFLPFVLSSWFV